MLCRGGNIGISLLTQILQYNETHAMRLYPATLTLTGGDASIESQNKF